MKTFALLALAASAKLAFAHTTIYAAWINDVDQGLGNSASGYIRSPPNNNPVKDVTSSDMTCNVNNVATTKTLSVAAGDKFTFEWHHNDRTTSDDIIASSHHGPVMVYIAPTETGTAGSGWVKLYEDGWTSSTDTWGVDTLITNKGKHSITIPDIAAGTYLLRAEIIALHEAENQGGAQFYMECVQIEVTSSGTTSLPEGVSIPGAYSATDPGILFDLYNTFTSYTPPGPAVWSGASGSSTASVASSAAVSTAAATTAATTAAVSTTAAVLTSTVAPTTSAAVSTQAAAVSSSSIVATTAAAQTTLATIVKSSTTSAAVASATSASTGAVAKYAQCGGLNYSGATGCASGLTCKEWNPYYHQCISA
ncbi:hypothetical protein MBLNU459_g3840t1 [Dothideomycetes sp. NU459]